MQRKPNYIFGFISNINAIEWMWPKLKDEFGFSELCTNFLNADTVENHNSEVRRRCGRNDAPNSAQFGASFKYAAIAVNEKLVEGTNIEADGAKPLIEDIEFNSKRNQVEQPACDYNDEPLDDEYERTYTAKELNGLMFIVGYAVLKIQHKSCRERLCQKGDEISPDHPLYAFCKLKRCSAYPSSLLYKIGLRVFNAFNQKFRAFLYECRQGVKTRLKTFVDYDTYSGETCRKCFDIVVDKLYNTLIQGFLKKAKNAHKRKTAAKKAATAAKRNRKAFRMQLPLK